MKMKLGSACIYRLITMQIRFSGEVWYWRGPAPFHFLTVPETDSRNIKEVSNLLTYGWGVIPVNARIGKTEWRTSLIPKNGLYLVPLKNEVRFSEGFILGDMVEIQLTFDI
jgi:hypothetical protein